MLLEDVVREYIYEIQRRNYIKNTIKGYLKEEKPLIKSLSDEQIKKMMNYYKGNSFKEIRNNAIISMLVDTGLQNSELCDLRIGDMRETVVFWRGKGRPISPHLKKLLIKYE